MAQIMILSRACTHIDKAHVHSHIVANSTNLDCTGKFVDFKRSGRAIRRISDLLCVQHGLSVITNPKPSRGRNYGKWAEGHDLEKPPSFAEIIRRKIDEILPSCSTFEDVISALRADGFTVSENRKHISVRAPKQTRPTRLNTLKGNYTEAAIRERLAGLRIVGSGSASGGKIQVSLLIDIQKKIQDGKGAGYAQWAKIFNLKQAAKTLLFLQENGIDSYDDLVKKSSSASGNFAELSKKIRAADTRLKEISELQKYIGQYGKTRDIYAKYKASGWNRDYYDEYVADITLHRAAKKYFDTLGIKKLPSIKALRQEYAALNAEKKKLYSGYRALKETAHSLTVAKGNADQILGIKPNAQNRDSEAPPRRGEAHEK